MTDCKVGTTTFGNSPSMKNGGLTHVMERARGDVFWRDGPVFVTERNLGLEDLCYFIIEYRVWPEVEAKQIHECAISTPCDSDSGLNSGGESDSGFPF